MKALIAVFCLFLAMACQAQAPISSIEADLRVLASDSLQGRLAGSEGERMASAYLSARFAEIGLKTLQDSSFLQSFTATTRKGVFQMQNVVGMIKGTTAPNEYVVLSAHYDHIGFRPAVDGDSIANGADDDASGVAALLWLAEQFAQKPANRSIVFVAFTGEEMGMLGSKHFMTAFDSSKIVAGVNMEMLGKVSKEGRKAFFITGPDRSNMMQLMENGLADTGYRIFADPYTNFNLFMRSDNASLVAKGVPAHTISTDPIDSDPYYHTVNDEIETIDFVHLSEIAQGIYLAIQPLVNGMARPQNKQ